jgi:predicted peroxiredoxin|tara:strand:- start:408 stop:665 length:258 start_codon:yes stop_codon:yes gene_type:complete
MTSKQAMTTFHVACAAHIMGYKTGVTLKGSSERVKIFHEVLDASKDLYQTLNEAGVRLDTVKEKLNCKRMASKKFYACFGRPWVL